jgi:hypothetical protein
MCVCVSARARGVRLLACGGRHQGSEPGSQQPWTIGQPLAFAFLFPYCHTGHGRAGRLAGAGTAPVPEYSEESVLQVIEKRKVMEKLKGAGGADPDADQAALRKQLRTAENGSPRSATRKATTKRS